MSKGFWGAGGAFPWTGFAFGRSRFFEAGEIRLAILSLLAEGPKHGYQLMKELQERSGNTYRASAGSVYPTLQQLEDEGMVESEMIAGRRTYRLTKAGQAEVAANPDTIRRIWERAEECEDWQQYMGPEAFAVYAPLMDLVKVGLQAAARVRRKKEGAERIREILDRARRDLENL